MLLRTTHLPTRPRAINLASPGLRVSSRPRLARSRVSAGPEPLVLERLHAPAQERQPQTPTQTWSRPQAPGPARDEARVPVYCSLSEEVSSASSSGLKTGLKALKCIGADVAINIWWGEVESEAPQQYDWSATDRLLHSAREVGLRVRVVLCFHGNEKHTLPAWVLRQGQQCPDIFYTDRAGNRNTECLTLGVDDVPALGGRTAVQAYADFMAAFSQRYRHLLGSTITDAEVGLGPQGELRYPSTPSDRRWSFPGIGEFQCYDRFMLASLQAAAQHVGQPHWGLGGPHDAGTYTQWPHQTGFFHPRGSWASEYGSFFLQWYSSLLTRHAERVLASASAALGRHGVQLHARLPVLHWWYNQAAHAAELTAGIHNTYGRDGYLPILKVFSRHGCGVSLRSVELRTPDQPLHASADPELLLLQIRAGAAAMKLPVTLGNSETTFAAGPLAAMAQASLQPAAYRGIELPPADALLYNCMCDLMFEQDNWQLFRSWVAGVREGDAAAAAQSRPDSPGAASAVALKTAEGFSATEETLSDRLQPVAERFLAVQQQQQQRQALAPDPAAHHQIQPAHGAAQSAVLV